MKDLSQQPLTREDLRGAVKDEMRSERRRAFIRKMTIAGASLIVFLAIVLGGVGYLVAKAGFADVPIFTSRVYNPPAPTRVVYPLVGSKSADVVSGIVARAQYSAAAKTATVYASEVELTTMLRESLLQQGIAGAQVVVTPAFLEVRGEMTGNGRTVPMLLQVVPSIVEGKLILEPKEVFVGALEVPGFVATAGANAAASALEEALSRSLGGGALVNVVLSEMKLTATFTVPSK